MGEVGVMVLDVDYFVKICELMQCYGIFMICDEVQIGVGWIGDMFCFCVQGVILDVVIFVKGLVGGFFIGVVLVIGCVVDFFQLGLYGIIFGGNFYFCVVVNVVFDIIEFVYFYEYVCVMGECFWGGFVDIYYLFIREICGCGFLIGIEFIEVVGFYVE